MAVRLNCGEVQPYASMWGPTDLGRMTEASTITEIHQNPTAWDTKIEADTAEGKKYMFCALTPGEYNQCRTDDGTVDRTHHSEHTTGFTSWHCSIHDALTYALWCLLTGVILYTEELYICAWVPNPYKLVTQLYHGWSKGFNRGFQSLMVQGDAYTFDTCEHGTGRTLRIQMNWNRVLAEYSFENGWCWNQYIPMCIREYLDSSGMDPRHGAMSMVIYNHGVSFARHLQEPLRSDLLTYSERFRVHITKNWDEASNLGSTESRNKLVEIQMAHAAGTGGTAHGVPDAMEITHEPMPTSGNAPDGGSTPM